LRAESLKSPGAEAIYLRLTGSARNLSVWRGYSARTETVFECSMHDLDPSQYAEADRREVNPPIKVEAATWSLGGTLDWWVRERREWFGRVRGPNGRQKWIKASDLRPAK
jgi:hypothetical protein